MFDAYPISLLSFCRLPSFESVASNRSPGPRITSYLTVVARALLNSDHLADFARLRFSAKHGHQASKIHVLFSPLLQIGISTSLTTEKIKV
jgi:hypothetical protein